MYTTVHFYAQTNCIAVEVSNKPFDNLLPAEFKSSPLFLPQSLPQSDFGGGHVLPKLSCI
jgi:hypothetical protein